MTLQATHSEANTEVREPGSAAVRPVTSVPEGTPGRSVRWWAAVVVSGVPSLPLAWLLSYAASLPFFLGLFFFMLFGVIIGAVAYRVAAGGRPYASSHLLAGTTVLVLLVWGLSIVKESLDFPTDVADRASLRASDLGERTPTEFRRALADDVRRFLAERYPPGGVSGYVRWVLTNGTIKRGELTMMERGIGVPAAQTRVWWAVRVVLSIALLGYGIGSQTLPLSRPAEPGKRGGS